VWLTKDVELAQRFLAANNTRLALCQHKGVPEPERYRAVEAHNAAWGALLELHRGSRDACIRSIEVAISSEADA
jgi:hypothetical protein